MSLKLPQLSLDWVLRDLIKALIRAFDLIESNDKLVRKTNADIDLAGGTKIIGYSPDGTKWVLTFNDDGVPTQELP